MRYTEVTDQSSHHYYIPIQNINHWRLWMELDEDDPKSWETPKYAVRIDGGQLTFENPRIEKF